MPLHDWTRVRANRFHAFHQMWIVNLSTTLNGGLLPAPFVALPEQIVSGPVADVLTLELPAISLYPDPPGGVSVASAPPIARSVHRFSVETYARRASRISIQHPDGQVVAVIEIVSPGNKDSRHAIRSFVSKAARLLRSGVHLSVIDLFPPGRRDPQGIHKAIWDQLHDEPFELPPGQPLTAVAYAAGPETTAYVNNMAVGEVLPELAVFLTPEVYVPLPLEETYQRTWAEFPALLKGPLEAESGDAGTEGRRRGGGLTPPPLL